MRQRLVEEQSGIHAAALALWPVNPNAARAVLTRFGSEWALEVYTPADKLAETVASQRRALNSFAGVEGPVRAAHP